MNITILLFVKYQTSPPPSKGPSEEKMASIRARVPLPAKPAINPLKQLMPEAKLGQEAREQSCHADPDATFCKNTRHSVGVCQSLRHTSHKRRGRSNQKQLADC